ncbi:hypothetical protein PV10_00442 [Exophiala mesophila]|uniref:Uncharacterized protein n=1 Tax=Exophiala mesophila TaxID=212818 RepID=A0A0D1ZRN0_EXOME|nr:uncharacterized protein PV10_00442 [Exophiala mesophila]KIV96599.1 hypothetical protein PV10_00442 [Exophiala mesophila]
MKFNALFGLIATVFFSASLVFSLGTPADKVVAALMARDVDADAIVEIINLLPRDEPVTVTVTADCAATTYPFVPTSSVGTEVSSSTTIESSLSTSVTVETGTVPGTAPGTIPATTPATSSAEPPPTGASSTVPATAPPATDSVPATATVPSTSTSETFTTTTETISSTSVHTTSTPPAATTPPAPPAEGVAASFNAHPALVGLVALLALA